MLPKHDRERGTAILVRHIMFRISSTAVRFEQAYSADGGLTWEDIGGGYAALSTTMGQDRSSYHDASWLA
jgi:hypothetical protein